MIAEEPAHRKAGEQPLEPEQGVRDEHRWKRRALAAEPEQAPDGGQREQHLHDENAKEQNQ
jgi:hypothetical protein